MTANAASDGTPTRSLSVGAMPRGLGMGNLGVGDLGVGDLGGKP